MLRRRQRDTPQVEVTVDESQRARPRKVVAVRLIPEHREHRAAPAFRQFAGEHDRVQRLVKRDQGPTEERGLVGRENQ